MKEQTRNTEVQINEEETGKLLEMNSLLKGRQWYWYFGNCLANSFKLNIVLSYDLTKNIKVFSQKSQNFKPIQKPSTKF